MGAAEFYRAVPNSDVDVQTIDQLAKFLARFEEGSSLRWHFDSGSGFWIASDARSSLARVEASESADLNLVPGSQGTDDAVKLSLIHISAPTRLGMRSSAVFCLQ